MKKSITLTIIGLLLAFVYLLIEPVFSFFQFGEDISEYNQLEPIIQRQHEIDIKADSILKQYFDSLDAPSLSIAIGLDNALVWANAVGYASIESKNPADTSTIYRVGSISKSLTSVGLGKLLQSGQLALSSTAGEYVPYVSEELSNLTVGQLASHTAGIRNYGTCLCLPMWEFTNNDEFESVEASISVFGDDDLLFQPGTGFSYSTYNYTLLSGVIEGAAKKNFLDYMQDEVFTPLNLGQTVADRPETATNRAHFYEVRSGAAILSYPVNNSNKWAGGGFLSTPSDLVRFGNAVLHHELLDSATTNLLFTPILLANGEVNEQNYGLGWRNHVSTNIIQDHREVRMYHHGGSSAGGIAMLILLPEYNMTVAATMNRSGSSSDLFQVVYRLAELFILDSEMDGSV